MLGTVLVLSALGVAFANGANDNFKGVATLLGSGTAKFRVALVWATVATLCGSVTAAFLATRLMSAFGGKGLVPDELAADPNYLGSVACGAAATVLLATRIGIPISTTHSMIGGLLGAGIAAGSQVSGSALMRTYLTPLLVSPLVALILTVAMHQFFRQLRRRLRVSEETCFCVGSQSEPIAITTGATGDVVIMEAKKLTVSLGTKVTCTRRYRGQVAGFSAASLLDVLHYASAGLVSFARGLNDTPKIAALLVTGSSFSKINSTAAVALVIAVGGLVAARRVAETMGHRITPMNAGQGFAANLVTGVIVVGASKLGVPVSTTHISCGSLFGVGAMTAQARWPIIGRIVLAWVFTLPLAAAISAAVYSRLNLFN